MPDDKIMNAWVSAFNYLMMAQNHLKSQLGTPGEKAARVDHAKAIDAYIKASEEYPVA